MVLDLDPKSNWIFFLFLDIIGLDPIGLWMHIDGESKLDLDIALLVRLKFDIQYSLVDRLLTMQKKRGPPLLNCTGHCRAHAHVRESLTRYCQS